MSKTIFVTGTDTDIGKTFVSAKIVEALKQNGQKTAYYKPVQSGGTGDTDYLKNIDVDIFNSYTLKEAVSPHYASETQGVDIDREKFILDYINIKEKYDYTVVEGAGGVIVPIIRNEYYIYDLIENMNIPVLLVTDLSVGSINKTLLSYEFLKSRGIEVKAIFANRYKGKTYEMDNKKVLEEYTKLEVLTEIRGDEIEKLFK